MSDSDTTNDASKPVVPASVFKPSPELTAVMAKYGVIPTDVKAPTVHVTPKLNFDEVCVLTTPVYNDEMQLLKVAGHSGPMMYLKTSRQGPEENPNFKSRFKHYVAFMVYTFHHPQRGEIVVTNGVPESGPTELQMFLSDCQPGNIVQVAVFETSGGNRLFKAIPAQG